MSLQASAVRHALWVRVSHWIGTVSFLLLAVTGIFILMVHPRLYWGEVGNDLTPAFMELPISRNYKHNGWDNKSAFFDRPGSPVSASRTYDIFNENGWGRSLHFLSAWILVGTGVFYLFAGLWSGHFRRRLVPGRNALGWRQFRKDFVAHVRSPFSMGNHADYNLLQRLTYLTIIFIFLPLVVLTGLAMSPAITASIPALVTMFGGTQSARTIHFFASVALELFLVAHLVMVTMTGFKQNIKAMTIGK